MSIWIESLDVDGLYLRGVMDDDPMAKAAYRLMAEPRSLVAQVLV